MSAKTVEKVAGLDTPVGELTGVGSKFVEKLGRLGIKTVSDLLHYFPRRYDDLRSVKTLDELQQFGGLLGGQVISLRAKLLATESRRTRFGKTLVTAHIGNEKGFIEAVWFNQPYLARQLQIDAEYIFSGKLKTDYRPTLQNPSYEPVGSEQTHTARLVPVYPETEGLTSKWLRAKLKPLLELADAVPDGLPQALRDQYKLPGVAEALRQIHFPDSPEQADAARRRFDFEQILLMQLVTLTNRQSWQSAHNAPQIAYDPEVTKRFVTTLPWKLTDDQRRSAHEILQDLASELPMMRLLQGDVGSGKTAVAAIAAHQVTAAGWQAAIMAPTEVLARQHAATLETWFCSLKVPVVLLLGSQKTAERKEAITRIDSGQPAVLVGTHALIAEQVNLHKLALAVVDEQHRFGVEQRNRLRGGHTPHLLTMTATPIPRSLALVAYGDQDLSVLQEVPAGRQPVSTELVAPPEREQAYAAIREQLSAGRQAFIVYPVIEQSISGLRDATSEYQRLDSTVFADFRVGLLHGRLKTEEKQAIMAKFKSGRLDVLVSTSVIEVGVDVPNATVMVIEEAQQFGLAQLHQFRGRIGRGADRSFCYLLPGEGSNEDNQRLQAMVEHRSGFKLAKIDLGLRGPGDLIGIKQSGFDVSLAALTDPDLLRDAKSAAAELTSRDPELADAPLLAERLQMALQA